MPAFGDWLVANRQRYALREVRSYTATRGSAVEPRMIYVVCELVPVPPISIGGSAGESRRSDEAVPTRNRARLGSVDRSTRLATV